MKVAICDDQKYIADELIKMIKNSKDESIARSECMYFSKPSALYQYMQDESFDIVFMDLDFEDDTEDGIMWLKRMKGCFPQTIMIILTANDNRYKEGFEARVFRFMTKPIDEKELFNYLYMSMEELQIAEKITMMRRGMQIDISIRDICYISVQAGRSEVWTLNDMFYSDESLLQWERRLPETVFFRCHSKYIVNLAHVLRFDNQCVVLKSGELVPVARRRWKAFQLAFMKFDTKDFSI